jgi:hypothetical protein
MPKPFDRPPQPKVGDNSADPIYMAVGRALSEWELTEQAFARLFGLFIAPEWPTRKISLRAAERAYGSLQSAKGRKEMTAAAADELFANYPHPTLPNRLNVILDSYMEAGARRNDFAHGMVTFGPTYDEQGQNAGLSYTLVPGPWNTNKTKKVHRKPDYIYSSAQIVAITANFKPLRVQVGEYAQDLLAHIRASLQRVRELREEPRHSQSRTDPPDSAPQPRPSET